MIAAYLAAIFAANLIVTAHPTWSPYIAFALIGLVLVVRDRLHRRWEGAHLAARMGGLIVLGGLLSYLAQPAAGRIVIASVLAFVVAEALDAVTFHVARRRPWLERSNVSNLVGAAADSVIFVFVAFGGPWQLAALQFVAKVAGGLIWSLVLAPRTRMVVTA